MDRQTEAFGLIANRSLGAQADSLKQIRDTRSFETSSPNWEQFCERKAGISRSYAAKLIQRLEEFGVNYFKRSEIAHVSSDSYCALVPPYLMKASKPRAKWSLSKLI